MGTPPSPPDAPPVAALIREYGPLIRRTARYRRLRSADVDDCAQDVLIRFYRAIDDRRLDVSDPKGIGGWLIKTTRSVVRDFLKLHRHRYEILTTTGVLDRAADTRNREDRMAEAHDVHEVIDRILDRMPPKQREVFVMSDLEDTSMVDIIGELGIPKATAYARLEAGREAFAREWNAMQKGGTVAASLALLSVHELITAEHTVADVPQSFTDEMLRRLGEELGQGFLGPAGGAVAASVGAAAGSAKAGGIMLTTWQLGLGVIVVGIAGAALMAVLRPAGAPPPPAPLTLQAPERATPAPPSALSAPPPRGGAPADVKPGTPPSSEIQTGLLDNARALLKSHQPARALALLARVTVPELVEERDDLRRLALAELPDGGQR